MQYLLVVIGFALLIKGADWLVESAKQIAFSLGVSAFIVGMSVVALGTSMPEAAIGVISGIEGTNDISLGDVLGSCIANIALILGVGALIQPIAVARKTVTMDIPISFGSQAVLLAMMLLGAVLTRVHGAVLLVLFLAYCFYLARKAKQESGLLPQADPGEGAAAGTPPKKLNPKLILLLILGLAGLVAGAKLVVDNGVAIAKQFGMSEALIGVTVVALGTSLPELVTTIMAAIRKQNDIAIGNVIGSNIINVTLILGLTVTIHPIPVLAGTKIIAIIMLAVTALLFLLALRKKIGRAAGLGLLAVYAGFLAYSILDVLHAGK